MKRNADIGILYKAITIWEQDVGVTSAPEAGKPRPRRTSPTRGGQAIRPDHLHQAPEPSSCYHLGHYLAVSLAVGQIDDLAIAS